MVYLSRSVDGSNVHEVLFPNEKKIHHEVVKRDSLVKSHQGLAWPVGQEQKFNQ